MKQNAWAKALESHFLRFISYTSSIYILLRPLFFLHVNIQILFLPGTLSLAYLHVRTIVALKMHPE